jgi:hypothetical protein
MSEQLPTGEQFIDSWFEKQREREQLNQKMLSLIDEHRSIATLAEDELLEQLIAISERETEENVEG